MKWIRARVTFRAQDPDSAAALIADIFYDLGLQGVIMESPDADPELDWAADALPAAGENAVVGFFRADADLAENRRALEKRLSELRDRSGDRYRVSYSNVDEQDWAESWKAHFHPVRISDRLVVKPTWREYAPTGKESIIELDPGMAFGTGTHPTTALCLRLIERYVQSGMRVIDIGTGSGILLIAAAKLGAGRLRGIDCDPVAAGIAGENLRLNHVDEQLFCVSTGNLVDSITEGFDMAVANILTNTILPMIPQIPPLLEKGGIFITSGITAENKDTVTAALAESGFEILEVLIEDEWAAIAARATRIL